MHLLQGRRAGRQWISCPALVGNPTLRQQQAAIFTEWFPNGDGLLAVHREEMLGPDEKPILFHLLLTDSEHYLLPTDNTGAQDVPCDTSDKVSFLTKDILREALAERNTQAETLLLRSRPRGDGSE